MLKYKKLFKILAISFIAGVLGIVTLIVYIFLTYKQTFGTVTLPNGQSIYVETADTPFKQALGLMGRDSLEQNTGMLFIFSKPDKYAFWMKNTLLPLDIIWLDENMRIVDIKNNVQPCTTKTCEQYKPETAAKYVLELNSGDANKNFLNNGDFLLFSKN